MVGARIQPRTYKPNSFIAARSRHTRTSSIYFLAIPTILLERRRILLSKGIMIASLECRIGMLWA
jgi:hypothetical protein